jgi:hypothetical protein
VIEHEHSKPRTAVGGPEFWKLSGVLELSEATPNVALLDQEQPPIQARDRFAGAPLYDARTDGRLNASFLFPTVCGGRDTAA